jgi:hypothetical protein
MRTAESNRLEATLGADEVLRRSLEDHMAYLDAEIKRTEKLIHTHQQSSRTEPSPKSGQVDKTLEPS